MERCFTVAFTGHRSYCHQSDDQLRSLVDELYSSGALCFCVGMAEGFDMAAAECVLQLKKEHPEISLEAYIPFPSFASRFSLVDRLRYDAILRQCDSVNYATEEYEQSSFMMRNDRLVANAEVVVAWWNGTNSGTGYTVRQARRSGVRVINIYPSTQYSLEF